MVGSRSQATRCMEESVLTWNQSRTTVQRWVLWSGRLDMSSYSNIIFNHQLPGTLSQSESVPAWYPGRSHHQAMPACGTSWELCQQTCPRSLWWRTSPSPSSTAACGERWTSWRRKKWPNLCLSGERHVLQVSRSGWLHHWWRSERSAGDEKCWIPRHEQRGHHQPCLWSKYFYVFLMFEKVKVLTFVLD